ncbi:putative peptidase S54, rhomboid [Rosa chinensis]|uniref:RHOMBOID-like protein n=1 Tax=Rosa chinensis TaxID=74649 RepID=A0A2P6Q119_ROSCH|nr:putative peptidase S54, rhomboid [Rosa chinensis]
MNRVIMRFSMSLRTVSKYNFSDLLLCFVERERRETGNWRGGREKVIKANKVRIGLLYVISGLGGSLMSSLFIQSNIYVGASGALFGFLGAVLSELDYH